MRAARLGSRLVDEFAAADVLDAADVHVARALSRLGDDTDERVVLAAALTVRAVRLGSVCVDLRSVAETVGEQDEVEDGHTTLGAGALPWPEPEPWVEACLASPLVAGPGGAGRPLRLAGSLLYLDRYWGQEQQVRAALDDWASRTPPVVDTDRLRDLLHSLFSVDAPDHQRLAAAAAATGWFTVVAGGPGTGKTTTVARLLATVDGLTDQPIRVALAAPTGRAAARLEEAVTAELSRLGEKGFAGPGPFTSSTVHRLLGSRPGSTTRFWHDRRNHLPHDVVVVDEASMMSLTLVARLLEALRPDCRLVMVGDPDQLVSVEAGAVLGDIVHRSPRPEPDARLSTLRGLFASDLQPRDEVESDLCADVVRLRRNFRFGGAAGLNDLAEAVRSGEADAALAVLQSGDASLEFVDVDAAQAVASSIAGLREDAVRGARRLVAEAEVGDAAGALDALGRHRLLCAHREGPNGISYWRHLVRRWLVEAMPEYGRDGEFYVGRPLLVTANDYEVGLFNGDVGAVIMRDGQAVAAFGPEGPFVATSRLSEVQTPHAMTVHKAQGSEADRVTVILPSADSPLLTRELLYTAITRARSFVRLIGTQDAVRTAVTRPVVRASGLRES